MPITARQQQARQKHLGSSDVPALFGKSPWSGPYDVWLEKTGRVEPSKPTEWQTAGTFLERGILEWASQEFGLGPIVSNAYRARPLLHLGAHIDAVVKATGCPIEAKAAGAWGSWAREFGEPGTDSLPDYVILQCHVHMICLEGKGDPQMCWVPHCSGGYKLSMYEVPKSEALATAIKCECVRFWNEHVLTDTPPKACVASSDTLKRVIRTPDSVGVVDPETVAAWITAKAEFKHAKEVADMAQREVLTAMDSHDGATVEGVGDLTYYTQETKRVDTKKMKADGIYDEYASVGSHRVLRYQPQQEKS